MDATGNVGVEVDNSEITWDAGLVDADTILKATSTTGKIIGLTDTGTGTQIDASVDTILTTIGYSLNENRMSVDGTSIVHEANYLSLSNTHLGTNPTDTVGLKIVSDQNFVAYGSPTFENNMDVDGLIDDWFSGNELNPSGFAVPGRIGGPMLMTVDGSELVLGFENVDTSLSEVYVYFNTNDIGGITTGLDNIHTLPFGAEYALKVTSSDQTLSARDVNDAWICTFRSYR